MLSRTHILAYASPAVGIGALFVMIALYLPSLYVDEIGVPLSHFGVVTTIIQIANAATDPIFGQISDRSKLSCGRRRPFVLAGSCGLAVFFVGLFSPPRPMTASIALAYATAMVLCTSFFVSMARVPWLAWALEMTQSYHERTVLVSVREFLFVIGTLLAAGLPLLVGAFINDEFVRLTVSACTWAIFAISSGCICCKMVADPPPALASIDSDAKTARGSDLISFLRQFLCNRAAVALYVSSVMFTMGSTTNALIFPFFIKYVIQQHANMELLLAVYIITGALFVPMWSCLSKRWDKKSTLTLAIFLQAVTLAVIFSAVDRESVPVYVACLFSAGIAFGGTAVVRFSMMADVADVQQLLCDGKRDEGKLVALFDISGKLASSVLIAVSFWVIEFSGYQPDVVPQTPRVQWTIRIVYALVPCFLAVFAGAVIYIGYPLDRTSHAAMLAKLEAQSVVDKSGAADTQVVGSPSQAC